MLTKVRGPEKYKDIKTYAGIQHNNFRDACFVRGLLDDDMEFINVIKKVSFSGSGHELRILFATMLLSNTLSRPEHVWDQTWSILSEDILYMYRRSMGYSGKIYLLSISFLIVFVLHFIHTLHGFELS